MPEVRDGKAVSFSLFANQLRHPLLFRDAHAAEAEQRSSDMGRKALLQKGQQLVPNPVPEIAPVVVRTIFPPAQAANSRMLPHPAPIKPEKRTVKTQSVARFALPHAPRVGAGAPQKLQEKSFHLILRVMSQGQIATARRAGGARKKLVPPLPRRPFRFVASRAALLFQKCEPVRCRKLPNEGGILPAVGTPTMIKMNNRRTLAGENQSIEQNARIEPPRDRSQEPDRKVCHSRACRVESWGEKESRIHGGREKHKESHAAMQGLGGPPSPQEADQRGGGDSSPRERRYE